MALINYKPTTANSENYHMIIILQYLATTY